MVPSNFQGDIEKFKTEALRIFEEFQNYPPLNASAIPQLNVMMSTVESNVDSSSSSSEDSSSSKEKSDLTSFCWFNCAHIERLLCCTESIARELAASCSSGADTQILVVHNDEEYGGSGGAVGTVSIELSAPKIAVHELGHSLFSLGDEYTTGWSTPEAYENCQYSNCSWGTQHWADLMGLYGVSCLAGSCKDGEYYVAETTIMKYLSYPFEEVNERLTCCRYGEINGTYPPYCDKFTNISDFCLSDDTSSTASLKHKRQSGPQGPQAPHLPAQQGPQPARIVAQAPQPSQFNLQAPMIPPQPLPAYPMEPPGGLGVKHLDDHWRSNVRHQIRNIHKGRRMKEKIDLPMQVVFKKNSSDDWVVDRVMPLRPGKYPHDDMYGDIHVQQLISNKTLTNITVTATYDDGTDSYSQVAEFGKKYVEYVGSGDHMEGWEPLEPTEIVMVTKGRAAKYNVNEVH